MEILLVGSNKIWYFVLFIITKKIFAVLILFKYFIVWVLVVNLENCLEVYYSDNSIYIYIYLRRVTVSKNNFPYKKCEN